MTWSFRLHFLLSDGHRITEEEPVHEFRLGGVEASLVLRSMGALGGDPVPISQSDELTLIGSGYGSEEETTEAAVTWQRRLTTALAANNIGADLGARSTEATFFTEHGQVWVRQLFGLRADDRQPDPR